MGVTAQPAEQKDPNTRVGKYCMKKRIVSIGYNGLI